MTQIRMLVTASDPQGRRFLKTTLERNGYTIITAENRCDAVTLASSWHPNRMLLDLELPTKSEGLAVLHLVRAWSHIPIIVLSVHVREEDTVAALTGGADDFVPKPFGVAELLARIQVALRHGAQGVAEHEHALTIGSLSIDLRAHRVTRHGHILYLTPTKYAILRILVLHQGHIVLYRTLAHDAWGNHTVENVTKLRVCINQLRRKIKDDLSQLHYLKTEAGIGYRFDAPEDVSSVVCPDHCLP